MLELVLSSFAGLATAVAIKKFPRGPPRATEAEPHIIPKIAELEIERDVLTKTIARLYRHEDGLTRVQYNRLLAKYQHQLGETAGRIEWLRSTGAEPSLHGGLADLDQKLSHIEERLGEMSSKISAAGMQKAREPAGAAKPAEPARAPPTDVQAILLPDIEIDELDTSAGVLQPATGRARPATPGSAARRSRQKIKRTRQEPAQIAVAPVPSKPLAVQSESGTDAPDAPIAPVPSKPPAAAQPTAKVPGTDPAEPDDADDLEALKLEITKTLSKLSETEVE